jgi:2-polyprenyl-3-methyl-5-hydroxy-6-metoxy-1,4-benzoquinol methylase
VNHFKKPNYELMNRKQTEYIKTLYGFRTLDSGELHNKLVDNEQLQKEWDQFHEGAASIYDVWENEPDEIVPIKKCITIIKQLTPNLPNNDDIVIIDMGCGLAKLAQHFKPVNNMRVISIDHRRHPLVPADIVVLEADMKNATVTIGEKIAYFVVFSLSLWGNTENITRYIHVATDLLKLNGYMILIDAKKNIVNNNNLENYVISLLNKENRLRYQVSPERPNSRFFCIIAERRQELKF